LNRKKTYFDLQIGSRQVQIALIDATIVAPASFAIIEFCKKPRERCDILPDTSGSVIHFNLFADQKSDNGDQDIQSNRSLYGGNSR